MGSCWKILSRRRGLGIKTCQVMSIPKSREKIRRRIVQKREQQSKLSIDGYKGDVTERVHGPVYE